MSLNWREIDAVLEELSLAGSRVQKIRQPNFKELVLDLYRSGSRFSVLISLEPGRTRLHLLTRRVESEVKLQRFAQLLRSRLIGGAVTEASQIGEERIVHLGIERGDERTELYIRLWSGAANIIATDERHEILDACYRRPNRNEVSGARFDPEEAVNTAGGRKRRTFEVRDFPGDGSLNERIERFYADTIREDDREALRERLLKRQEREANGAQTHLAKLRRRLERAESGEDYRRYGDLIAANLYRIRRGDDRVRVADYHSDDAEIEIELDPRLSGGENADRYYKLYKKNRERREHIAREIESLEHRLLMLQELREEIEEAEDLETLESTEKRIAPAQRSSGGRGGGDDTPGLRCTSGEFTLLVGRSAKENDALLRNHVRGNDYWIHTRDFPGGYVFVKSIRGKSVPLDVLLDAGNLAIHFSKAKSEGSADLFYTQVKYLRRAKEGKPGLVIPTQERNLTVELDPERIARLLG